MIFGAILDGFWSYFDGVLELFLKDCLILPKNARGKKCVSLVKGVVFQGGVPGRQSTRGVPTKYKLRINALF